MGGKTKTPATPNYPQIAAQQGDINYQGAVDQFRLNNPDVYNQYGRVNNSVDPATGQASVETQLSPSQQKLYDNSVNQNLAWQNRQNQAWQNYQTAVGQSGDARQQIQDALYNRAKSTLDPQYDQYQQETDAQLANEGIFRGSELFDKTQGNLARQRDAAYADARDRSILAGGQEQSRVESQAGQNLGLIQSQYQYQNPIQAGGVTPASFNPADFSGAANAQFGANLNKYNANSAQNQQYLSLLGQLGSAAFLGL